MKLAQSTKRTKGWGKCVPPSSVVVAGVVSFPKRSIVNLCGIACGILSQECTVRCHNKVLCRRMCWNQRWLRQQTNENPNPPVKLFTLGRTSQKVGVCGLFLWIHRLFLACKELFTHRHMIPLCTCCNCLSDCWLRSDHSILSVSSIFSCPNRKRRRHS